jgi:hypothetical protein
MKTLIAFVIALALGLPGLAQAMPVAPDQAPASMVTQVAGGCGAGFHRGPYGGCRANGYYGGVYYGSPAVVVAPAPVYNGPGGYYGPVGPCGGRGMHRVCNGYGRCWSVCN